MNDYLSKLLNEKQKNELVEALSVGKTIVVTGEYCSGKTTLVKVLKERGYNALEDFEIHEVKLTKPLSSITPNKKDTVI